MYSVPGYAVLYFYISFVRMQCGGTLMKADTECCCTSFFIIIIIMFYSYVCMGLFHWNLKDLLDVTLFLLFNL